MNIYISIGSQCTTPFLFDRLGVKAESLPFDWMFSTPYFVYSMMKLLLIDKLETTDIVDNYFFACDKTARWFEEEPAHYINAENGDGNVLINSKYNVAFPHDTQEDREKYIRRFERLKQLILDESIFINFVYVSIPRDNYFVVNEIEPIENLHGYIEKINNIIKEVRSNFKILVFDTNKPSDVTSPDILHIFYYDIEKKHSWGDLLPELIDKCNMINNK
jgi:hypothetical protein